MQQPGMAGQGMAPGVGQNQNAMVPQSQSGATTLTSMSSLHHPLAPHTPHPNMGHSQMQPVSFYFCFWKVFFFPSLFLKRVRVGT